MQRKILLHNYCIEGWLNDTAKACDAASPEAICDIMTDETIPPWTTPTFRPSSPTKRQRVSDATSSAEWPERVDRATRIASDISYSATFSEQMGSTTSPSRAPSPTKSIRRRRVQLDYTIPAVYFGPPQISYDSESEKPDKLDAEPVEEEEASADIDKQIRRLSLEEADLLSGVEYGYDIPAKISSLIKQLSESAADPVLPQNIITRIQRLSPTETFPNHISDVRLNSTSKTKEQLRYVSELFETARDSYARSADESAWYPLIHKILTGPSDTISLQPFVKPEEAQTKLICSELLPRQAGKPIPTVKVDHVLQFNPDNRQICPLYKSVFRSQESLSLSAFSDPGFEKTFTCAIVEVKSPGGNFQEASYQLAVGSAAILERIRLLDPNDSNDLPVVGWVVHGHFWTLHVSYREADGSIVCYFPDMPLVYTANSIL